MYATRPTASTLKIGKVCRVAALGLALIELTGCQAVPGPNWLSASQSTVVQNAVQNVAYETPEAEQPPLESAQVVYVRQVQRADSTDHLDGGQLILLAVEYPHPDGRADRGRAEVVVTEQGAAEATTSWSGRLGERLGGLLPGLELGAGIQQAHSLDVPRSELQRLLASPAEVSPRGDAATHIRLAATVNGQALPIATTRHDGWERLAARVVKQGKLIAYAGDRATLEQEFGFAAARWQVAPATARLPSLPEGLHHLPPVLPADSLADCQE